MKCMHQEHRVLPNDNMCDHMLYLFSPCLDLDGNGYIDADEFRRMMRDGFDIAANAKFLGNR